MQNLKRVEIDVPADKVSVIEEFDDALKEAVAETDEALMDRFFEGGDFTYREMITGLHQGVKDLSLFPVLCGSGLTCLGSLMLMDNVIDLLPNPVQGNYHKATTADGKTEEFVVSPGGVPCAYVWKTVSDQYGKYSYVKVLSGEITSDTTLVNARTGETEKLGRLYTMCGKKSDGGQGSGLRRHRRHRQDGQSPHRRHPVRPQKGRLPEADPLPRSLLFHGHRPQGEGSGRQGRHRPEPSERGRSLLHPDQQRRDQAAGHLRHRRSAAGRAGLQAEEPLRRGRCAVSGEGRLPGERLKKKVEAHGRHKKQTGGSGQFGDVWIRFEPQEEQDDMIFAEEVFGGSVPKNFYPAVEKGIQEAVQKGPLAGLSQVVGLSKATLYDGSYHPVDSNEMAFKLAAILAFKEAMPNANPTLLEPIGALTVTVPDSYVGDVMGDLSKRRGRPMGMSPDHEGNTVTEAEVPMAEMSSYAIDLRAMTQARGSFTLEFVRYEEVPKANQAKIIADAKAND